jgi:hypothetical protein
MRRSPSRDITPSTFIGLLAAIDRGRSRGFLLGR